ncbi:MAG: Fic family protein, partial [Anaeroplasmataceae bacterium]|nr:Fic family protein [Anaeroplasmataceae bacterium]
MKLISKDGKQYLSDVLDEEGIHELLFILPSKNRPILFKWIRELSSPLDEQSKILAYSLFGSDILNVIEVGSSKGLQQIHAYIFAGLYDFAGKIRNKNISKNGFTFANHMVLENVLQQIDAMPEESLEQIVDKYIEMNIAHPFLEGNGRATRIWLDLILKKRLKKCVDWSLIDKKEYLHAMECSPMDSSHIYNLIKDALTNLIHDREI